MDCPYCSHKGSKVTNKRKAPEGIRRRRECLKCGKRFTTYEKIAPLGLTVIKKDGRRQLFDREKLIRGMTICCEKRISPEKVQDIAQKIEEKIRKTGKEEIKSTKIGQMVMNRLKKLDNIAYLRFASIYRDFQNIQDFQKELKEL